MDTVRLLERLLAARDEAERHGLLRARRHLLDTAFFQVLKGRVLELARKDSQEALRAAGIGLEAAKEAVEPEGIAYAWWARGVSLHFLGEYDDCLDAYRQAISILADLGQAEPVAQLQTNCIPPLIHIGRLAEAQTMGQSALQVLEGQGPTRPLANLRLNLGICARLQRDYAQALTHIEQAADIFSHLGDDVQAARCRVTQAVALENLDRFAEAGSLLRDALPVFAQDEAWLPWARAALNLGILHSRLANHQTALQWLEESRQAFLKVGNQMEAAIADLYRAHVLLDVHLWPEVAALGRELIGTFEGLKMPRQIARAASLLTEVHTRQGRQEMALRELSRARQIFQAQGDSREAAWLDLRRAALLREGGRPGEALRLATEAADALDVDRYPLRHAETHLLVAACCEDLGRMEEAQIAYRVAWAAGSHPTGTTEPPPMLAYRIAHARGAAAEAAGRRSLARGEYERAVGYLTRIAQGLGLDELRGGYLADKRQVYEAALRLALEDGRTDDAFRCSELARAGALRDFLAGGQRPGPRVQDDEQAILEELKARWTWRASGLRQPVDFVAEADEEEAEPEDRAERLRQLAALERELADAYRRRRLADPRLAVLEQGEVLSLSQVRRNLPGGTALLAFDHVDSYLLAFVVASDGTHVVPLGSLERLRWQGARLGHSLEEVRLFDEPTDLAMLEADLVRDLQGLYRAVLAGPLARLGPDAHRLIVVPCDVLHTLPLEAFHDGQRYLVERYAVCYLPAASLLTALPEDRKATGGPALVMANSWEGRLPLVLEEAAEVAQTLANSASGEPDLLREDQATAHTLRRRAGAARLLHVAAHGAFRDDAPLFSSLHLADGPLTVNEVYGLDLSQTALVTLSGCQTGLGQGRGGEMLGLTHAFFFAGAPALVVSRWRVDDTATAKLIEDFYQVLAQGETVAEALRTAQLNLLAHRPHTYYWGGLAVWGRGVVSIFEGD